MSHFSEAQMTPVETMQETRKFDKRLGYFDCIAQLHDILNEMDIDRDTRLKIQSAMIQKMGVYQRPTDANLYDKL